MKFRSPNSLKIFEKRKLAQLGLMHEFMHTFYLELHFFAEQKVLNEKS